MARYCFYCGRQLNSGEKCGCRSTGNGAPTQQASSTQAGQTSRDQTKPKDDASSHRQQKDAPPAADPANRAEPGDKRRTDRPTRPTRGSDKKTSWFSRLITAFNPWAATQPGTTSKPGGTARSGSGSAAWRKQGRPVRLDRHVLLGGLRAAGNYFVHPADQISQSVRTENRLASVLILALNGMAGGLFLNLATQQPHLKVLFSLNTASAVGRRSVATFLFLFIQGFGINLAASLLLVLIYHLSLRYLFHRPTGYVRLLHSLCPSILYFTVFVLSGLLSLNRSPFTALLMAVAGFAVAAVIQFLSLKQLTGMEDNRNLILIGFVMLVFSSILALLFNLSLPVLNALLDQSAII
jgi:hypothetical protein